MHEVPGYALTHTLRTTWRAVSYLGHPLDDPQAVVEVEVLEPAWSASADDLARVERSAQDLSALETLGAQVAQRVIDVSASGQVALVWSWAQDGTLAELLERQGSLSWDEVRPLVSTLTKQLAAAHQQGFVHGGLRAERVELVQGSPVLRWAPGGLSGTHYDDEAGVSGLAPALQVGHLAPEQVEDHSSLSPAVDVYGLGILVYRLLSGHRSVYPEALGPFINRLLDPAPPSLDALLGRAPDALAELVGRCLSHAPSDRPELGEVYAALSAILASDRPLELGRPPEPAPLPKRATTETRPAPSRPAAAAPEVLLDPLPEGYVAEYALGATTETRRYLALTAARDELVTVEVLQGWCGLDPAQHGPLAAAVERAVQAPAHPHIARCLRVERSPRCCAVIWEPLPWGTLAERIDRVGPLPWPLAHTIALELAAALGTAHAAGTQHGWLQPAHVLLDSEEHAKLCWRVPGVPTSGSRLQVGSSDPGMAYRPPELLVENPRPSSAADVYGFGCLLHFMLTGTPPFVGDTRSLWRLIPRGLTGLDPLGELRARSSPLVERIVTEALATQPEQRPAMPAIRVALQALGPELR